MFWSITVSSSLSYRENLRSGYKRKELSSNLWIKNRFKKLIWRIRYISYSTCFISDRTFPWKGISHYSLLSHPDSRKNNVRKVGWTTDSVLSGLPTCRHVLIPYIQREARLILESTPKGIQCLVDPSLMRVTRVVKELLYSFYPF